jgi:hypothetical protein
MMKNTITPVKTVQVDRNASTEMLQLQYDGVYSMLQMSNWNTTHPVALGLWDVLNELDDELREREREAALWVAGWD